MHHACVDRVVKFEYSLADSKSFNWPLSDGTVVGAWEHSAKIFYWFEMIDSICMSEQWKKTWRFFTWLQRIDIPRTNKTITIAWEHQLVSCVAEEIESSHIILNLLLSFVIICVKRVIWAEVFNLTICLLVFVEIVLWRFIDDYVCYSLTLALINDYKKQTRKSVSFSYLYLQVCYLLLTLWSAEHVINP